MRPAYEHDSQNGSLTPGSKTPLSNRGGRILLYSPDSYGLGHLRRSVNIASCLVRQSPNVQVLIVSGSPCATLFELPKGVDLVKLPSISKDDEGHYCPNSLGTDLDPILSIRASLIEATMRSWRPDVLVVDHRPRGLGGELMPALRTAHEQGCRTILGLRDILDGPAESRAQLRRPEVLETLRMDYDALCVYGDPGLFDFGEQYELPPDLRARLTYTGYISRPRPRGVAQALPSILPQVLVTFGGGQDGGDRVECLLDALDGQPPTFETTLILGPLLDSKRGRRAKRRARMIPGVTVHTFYENLPRLMNESDAVVSMAGYNTVTEILVARVPAVLLPRTVPRKEQVTRARRLQELGLARCVESLDPANLRIEIQRAIDTRPNGKAAPSLNGCARMAVQIARWLRPTEDSMQAPITAASRVQARRIR